MADIPALGRRLHGFLYRERTLDILDWNDFHCGWNDGAVASWPTR